MTPDPDPIPDPDPDPDPDPNDPVVTLDANPPAVALNASSTLTWTTENVNTCEASGDWTGDRDPSGTEAVGPLDSDRTYSLNCTGDNGSALESIGVTVRIASLSWSVSGAVDSFTLHYGSTSGAPYDSQLDFAAGVTEHVLELTPGTYFFAMTATDVDGTSPFSNEVSKTVL